MPDRHRPEPFRRLTLAQPAPAPGAAPAQRPAVQTGLPTTPSPTPPRTSKPRALRGAALLEDARGEETGRAPIGISNDGREVWETGTVEVLLRPSRG